MSRKRRRGWWAGLIALAVLVGGSAWWGAGQLLRGADPAAAARSAYVRGDWGEAAGRAREVLKAAPADAGAIRLLARSSARLGRDDAAQALFQRLGTDALEAEDDLLLARIFARHNRPDQARARLWAAYGKDPRHGEALYELVHGLVQDDALERAAGLTEAMRAAPGWRARGEVALGLIRAAQDDPAAAAESLEAALRRDPTLEGSPALVPVVHKLLARHSLALGQPARARAALGTLDDPEARWLLARADLQEGKPVEDRPNPARDPLANEPAPYVGSARCAECHASIARSQRGSHHARTFWAGSALNRLPLPADPLPDPANPAVVHMFRREGETTRIETRVDGQPYRALLAYAFGSGDLGLTPVGRDEAGAWYELRMSRYADNLAWDRTTGQEIVPTVPSEWLGKTLNGDELRRCVDCHTTAPRAARTDAGALAGDRGIGCERCHGPGGNHLKAVAAGLADLAIARPKLVSGEPIVRLCGRCHSPKGRTVSPSDPGSVRFQATTLTWSRCYTQSRDQLDCVTCHNPHRDAETSAAFYEAKCLECHGPSSTTHCPVNPTRDCIGCHMPTQRGVVLHIAFTDHHIRVHRPAR
jgi:tetratricopeptide (TPR) repeat protein